MTDIATPTVLNTWLTDFRRELHRFPELSNEEFETTRRLREALQANHIRILDLPLRTGLVAEVGGLRPGPLVVLRADIDALPIEEVSGVPWPSEHPGVMHACGHDFHSAAALGAAILLRAKEETLAGTVRIIFQPAEETGHGAPAILATGALDAAVAIFGIHNDPALPVGVIGSKAGALTAGVDRFKIDVRGRGSHAARPHEGNDPLIVAAHLVTVLQTLISRNIDSRENAVVSITQVHGGSTWNVIPETAWLEGTVRTFSQSARESLEQRFHEVIKGVAQTFNAEVTLDWQPGPPSVVNTAEWVDFALEVGEKSGFETRRLQENPIGEDFAFYLQKLPGAFIMVGSGGPFALHHPQFRVDDAALYPTAQWLAELAEAALTSEHLR